ncbi:trypsin-like serine peptidase [Roseicyclus persicicus]|uniref:Trypsin-like serine protease n=1 Tax=Roseicyclus persicicus TaxID=2650661 RepID=A0A7X6GX02_9RHOB|nr:trypsin-like peptidase domain-containing protein [Roseibacterium persicicum]NKX43219.1 trypsin-like serine protease [Roseibacterium persicicum]
MRRLVLALGAATLLAHAVPLAGQETLPDPVPEPALRALLTADAASPWEAVGRLDSGVSFCTATLIAPDLVLTAAHCLFDAEGRRLPDSALTFSASLRLGRAEAVRGVARAHLPEGYEHPPLGRAEFSAVAQDVALLELDLAIPAAQVAPMPASRSAAGAGPVTLVSYGAERAAFPSIEEECRVLSRAEAVQILSCRAVEGSSGAPVMRMGPSGPEIVAVVSGLTRIYGTEATVAVATAGLLAELEAARAAAGAGVMSRTPAGIRTLGGADTGRDSIGARFLRP